MGGKEVNFDNELSWKLNSHSRAVTIIIQRLLAWQKKILRKYFCSFLVVVVVVVVVEYAKTFNSVAFLIFKTISDIHFSLTHTLFPISHSLSLSLSLTFTHTHTHSFLSLPLPLSLSLSHSLLHTHTLTLLSLIFRNITLK